MVILVVFIELGGFIKNSFSYLFIGKFECDRIIFLIYSKLGGFDRVGFFGFRW